MTKRTLIALALAAAVATAVAQQDRPDGAVDAATRESAILELAKLMESDYVFADKGSAIAADLKRRLAAGEYNDLGTGQALARRVTEDMRKLTQDAHLNVRFSLEKLPERRSATKPTAEEEAQYRDWIRRTNAGYQKVERLNGNVGYLEVIGFQEPKDAARPLKAAMEFLSNTDALILDLRRNGGGDPAGVQLLCSYLFKDRVHLNDLYYRKGNSTQEYWTKPSVKGPKFVDKPVYVLVSKRTGSGAEECAYNLKNLKRATIVGENTWGGANPGDQYRLNDHFMAFIPTGRAINPYSKTNWEGTGVDPDVRIDPQEGLKHAHQLAVKALMAKAKTDADRARLTSVLSELGG